MGDATKGWNLLRRRNGGMTPKHAQLLASDPTKRRLSDIDRHLLHPHGPTGLQRTAPWVESLGLDHEVVCETRWVRRGIPRPRCATPCRQLKRVEEVLETRTSVPVRFFRVNAPDVDSSIATSPSVPGAKYLCPLVSRGSDHEVREDIKEDQTLLNDIRGTGPRLRIRLSHPGTW